VVGAAAVAFAGPLQHLLAGDQYSVDRVATLGWVLFAVAFAGGIPAGTLGVAGHRAKEVFISRVIDATVGVVCAVGIVAVTDASGTPFGLAAGAALGGGLLWVSAYRDSSVERRPEGAPGQGAEGVLAAEVM
ncbi:MAG: hypothetical protein ACRD0U_04680, partial [Acidimicrobiales bacterium]